MFYQLTKSQSIQTDQEPKPDSTSIKLDPAQPIQCSPDASDAKNGEDEAPVLTPNNGATEGKSSEMSCNCDEKYEKVISDLKAKMEKNHQDDKEKALEELSDRVSIHNSKEKKIIIEILPCTVLAYISSYVKQVLNGCISLHV